MADGKFVCVINCMDGRTQLPAIDYLKAKYEADYVDAVTEPGPVGCLSEKTDQAKIESIKARVAISVEKHGAKHIAIVAHCDCAGNPCCDEDQHGQLKDAVEMVRSWGFDADVIGLWIGGPDWEVSEMY